MAQTPAAGIVFGTVVDDSGTPVIHARIFIAHALPASAAHVAAPPVVTGPPVTTTMTDSKGEFGSTSLPAGDFVACAQLPTAAVLDPCHWGTSAPVFSIQAGKSTTGVRIVMARGAVLPIHIDDPYQLLTPAKGAIDPNCRFFVVTAKGYRYDAVIVAQGGNSRDHTITLPFGATLNLQVFSPHLVIEDGATGQPTASAGKTVATAPAGNAAQLNYTVTGTK